MVGEVMIMSRLLCRYLVVLCLSLLLINQKVLANGIGQQCGVNADADVVIMIDATGSVSTSEMTQQKNAAKALLNFFAVSSVKPRVAVGTFNVQAGPDARIMSLGHLTDVYGHDDPNDTGLFDVLNDDVPTNGNGRTDLSAAITIAQAELVANAQSSNRYILVISDGITNEPDAGNPSDCSGGNPAAAANAAAEAAEAAGSKIISIHFGDDSGCSAGTGVNFLRDFIATTTNLYHEGNGDLTQAFTQISQALVCDDDGDLCTLDTCENGICVHTPIGIDTDGDGVPDCADMCPGGVDTVLHDPCTAGIGECTGIGFIGCRCQGGDPWPPGTPGVNCQTRCNARPGDPQAETCNALDDDCDDLIDEEFHIGTTCIVGIGACMNTGQFICNINGGESCNVQPGQPTTEICNGIDDNCNETVDEGIANNGSCTAGVGQCQRTGELVCSNGGFDCNAQVGEPTTEVCNGLDDDCDGQIDEDIAPTGECSAGVGACQNLGQFVCVQGGLVCSAQNGEPSPETCNNVDDNCNGSVDEGFNLGDVCSVGIGACQNTGALICDNNGGVTCSAEPGLPGVEVCDQIDNDCDEQVDEVFDVCGIQCGDGSSCVTPSPSVSPSPSPSETPGVQCEGTIDNCGVCNGDGSSCLCTETSLYPQVAVIDANSVALEIYGNKMGAVAISLVQQGKGKKGLKLSKAKSMVKSILLQINAKHVESWSAANLELPQKSVSCGSQVSCVSIETTSIIQLLSANNNEMLALIDQIQKKLGVSTQKQPKSIFKAANKVVKKGKITLDSFPTSVSNCQPNQD